MTTDRLAGIIAKLTTLCGNSTLQWRRVRIAVSPEEMTLLQRYIAEDKGRFAEKLRSAPLVIEPFPHIPPRGPHAG